MCIIVVLALTLPACSESPIDDVSATTDISAEFEFTTAMQFAEGPGAGGTPDIVWRPCYLIANHGTLLFRLLNITLNIPYGIDGRTG